MPHLNRMVMILLAALVASAVLAQDVTRLTDPSAEELTAELDRGGDKIVVLHFTKKIKKDVLEVIADRLRVRLSAHAKKIDREMGFYVNNQGDLTVFAEGIDATEQIRSYLDSSRSTAEKSYTGVEAVFYKNCKDQSTATGYAEWATFYRNDGQIHSNPASVDPECESLILKYKAFVSYEGGQYFKNISMWLRTESSQRFNSYHEGAKVENHTGGENWGMIHEFVKSFRTRLEVQDGEDYEADSGGAYSWVVTSSQPKNGALECTQGVNYSISEQRGWNVGASLTSEVGIGRMKPGSIGIGFGRDLGVNRSTTETETGSITCSIEEYDLQSESEAGAVHIVNHELKLVGDPEMMNVVGDMRTLSGQVDANVAGGRGRKGGHCDSKYCVMDMNTKNAFPDIMAVMPPSLKHGGYDPYFYSRMQSLFDKDAPRVNIFNTTYKLDSYCGTQAYRSYQCGIYANHDRGGQIKKYDIYWVNGLRDAKESSLSPAGGDYPGDLAQIYLDLDDGGFVVDWRDHALYPVKSAYVQDQMNFRFWKYDDSLGQVRVVSTNNVPPITRMTRSLQRILSSSTSSLRITSIHC